MCNTELAFGYFSVANKPSISVYLEYYKVSNVNFSVAIIRYSINDYLRPKGLDIC